MSGFAEVPMQSVGPLKVSGPVLAGEYEVPLATFEAPLWPSVNRGARVSMQSGGGIRCTLIDERMTRSIVLEAADAEAALQALNQIRAGFDRLGSIVEETSRFARLIDMHSQIAGNLLYLRFAFSTGDAAGHNMCTQAAEALMNHILDFHPGLAYVSISGNYCSDKKATAVNGILGRGKYVVAELTVPAKVCRRYLKSEPERIVQLNIRKNLIGTMLAGGARSANAHFANMLLAFYLATGQDAANIVEGSQGLTMAEQRSGDLYFSVTLPNLIVGTVGSGKEFGFVQENLRRMGLAENREPGENARRLACLCAAAVLCGELSLLAAQTNPGELMQAHRRIERGQ
jgi:hydroxymethylglutaryl-CoA reductase (NADPH)